VIDKSDRSIEVKYYAVHTWVAQGLAASRRWYTVHSLSDNVIGILPLASVSALHRMDGYLE
jgi:hypothetical protein